MEVRNVYGEIERLDTKVCSICGEEKHIHEYALRSGKKVDFLHAKENRRNECCECKRELNRQTRIAKKKAGKCPVNHVCPICERNEIELRGDHNGWQKNNVWVLDHDHDTGEPREYICQHCNIGYGSNGFNENVNTLRNAIKYHEKWNKNFFGVKQSPLGQSHDYMHL